MLYISRKFLYFPDGEGSGDPDPDEQREADVQRATTTLDAHSDKITTSPVGKNYKPVESFRDKVDKSLKEGRYKESPRQVWSNYSKKEVNRIISKDPQLAKQVDQILNEDLGSKLTSWTKMVKKGTVDPVTFLKESNDIADIIAKYDDGLQKLSSKLGLGKMGGELVYLRETLHSIASYMSNHIKYIDKKQLWKQ